MTQTVWGASQATQDLQRALNHTGYYPEVIAEALRSALGDEDVVAYFVHHEPTFDNEEVSRHQTVVVLTESRLILSHADEHQADHLLDSPYVSTATEAISLTAIRNVLVTRLTANPLLGHSAPAEIVMNVSWGSISRIDLEPASCGDPHCQADHGYSGVLTNDDFALRISATADGVDQLAQLQQFAHELSRRTRG
jgi:hypothetical protein